MAKKRKLVRKILNYYLRVFDRNTDKIAGQLGNITTGGVMLISETPFEKNSTYEFWMELPSEMIEFNQIIFDARCAWSRKDKKSDSYNAGFQLTNISEKDIKTIEKLITDFQST